MGKLAEESKPNLSGLFHLLPTLNHKVNSISHEDVTRGPGIRRAQGGKDGDGHWLSTYCVRGAAQRHRHL